MEFALPPEYTELSAEAHAVGRNAAQALEIREDSWLRGTSREFATELAVRGWLGMTWPTQHGGGGRSPLERFAVVEALISEGAPIASIWFGDRQIGPTLLQFGTDAQRERFLPGLISAEEMWCVGMSEPDAGSDVASLRTRAERRGDRWIINGQKVWTSGAAESDFCYLIARTDPTAAPHAGLSEFIVDLRLPGVEIRPIQDMSNDRHFCEVHFTDVEVADDMLVGTQNAAFKQIMRQMEHERGGIDRLVSNRRTYLDVCTDAPPELLDHPVHRQQRARIEAGYRIGRLLVLREVLGQAPPGWSAVTKTWCTELEQDIANFCGTVLGAPTLTWGRVARNICYAPGYTIMGGTTQILRNIIGERLLGLPREVALRSRSAGAPPAAD
jgi:alkylation response protein AidB-like acyl-CoA dehydrogenase